MRVRAPAARSRTVLRYLYMSSSVVDDFDFGGEFEGESAPSDEAGDFVPRLRPPTRESDPFGVLGVSCRVCELPKKGKSCYCDKHRRAFECIKREATASSSDENPTPEHENFIRIFGNAKKVGNQTVAARVLVDFVERFGDGKAKSGRTGGGASAKKRGFVDLAAYVHSKGARREASSVFTNRKWDWEIFMCEMRNKRQWSVEKSKAEWDKLLNSGAPRDYNGPADAPLRVQVPSWMTGEDADEGRDTLYEDKHLDKQSKLGRMSNDMQDIVIGETRKGFAVRSLMSPPSVSEGLSLPLSASALTQGAPGKGDALSLLAEVAQEAQASAPGGSVTPHHTMMCDTPEKASPGKIPPLNQPVDIAHTRNLASAAMRKDLQRSTDKLRARTDAAKDLLAKGDVLEDKVYFEACSERLSAALLFLGEQVHVKADGTLDYTKPLVHRNFMDECVKSETSDDDAQAGKAKTANKETKPAVASGSGSPPKAGEKNTKGTAASAAAEKEGDGKGVELTIGVVTVTCDEGAPAAEAKEVAVEPLAPPAAAMPTTVTASAVAHAERHTSELRALLKKMPLLPVENPDLIESNSDLKLKILRIKEATSAVTIETTRTQVEQGLVYIGQLANSLRTASADLARENKRHHDQHERATKEQVEKQALQKKSEKEREEMEAKKRIQQAKSAQCFMVNWGEVGGKCNAIQVISGDAQADKVFGKSDHVLATFSEPFIFANSDALRNCLSTNVASKTMESWVAKFPARASKTASGQVVAPLRPAHGSDAFGEFFDTLLPTSRMVSCEKIPTLREKTSSAWLFGCDGGMFTASLEQDHLGTARVFANGKLRILVGQAADLFEKLPETVRSKVTSEKPCEDGSAREALHRVLSGCTTKELASELAKSVPLWHATIEARPSAPVALVLPAGAIACAMCLGGHVSYGVRKNFLPASAMAQKNLAVLMRLGKDDHLRSAVDALSISPPQVSGDKGATG